MKIAIIDDNEIMRTKIESIIKQEYSDKDVLTFDSIKNYEKDDGFYDLLLLDIELSDEHGIDYIKSHPQKHRYVIYVSSHNEYMIDAFHIDVIGFVPKNLMEKMLLDKIHCAEKVITNIKKYCFQTVDGDLWIEEQRILFVFFVDHTVCIQLENEKSPIYLMDRSLKAVDKFLSSNFYKVNRTHIINMKKIRRLSRSTHEVFMLGGKQIKVSDHRWVKFKAAYHSVRYHYG